MSTFAVVTEDVEMDMTFEGDIVGLILVDGLHDQQIRTDLTIAEARSLHSWLGKVLGDA